MKQRGEKTFGDYAGMFLSPILIMGLVGSFIFFALEVTYRGEHGLRLRWTLFWFVFASVLISRVSIEESFNRAGIYGVILGWATAMMIFRFVDFMAGVIVMLGFVWWCSSKLTWDCTLIDDSEDASGEGLLAVGGFEKLPARSEAGAAAAVSMPPKQPPWGGLRPPGKSAKPHAPGLWVLKFSLFALPCFGLGESIIPVSEPEVRARVHFWFLVYVASAVALLVTTSFLGLRRYLRQRGVIMPPRVAARWFATGLSLGAVVVACCLLLPRPQAMYSGQGIFGSIHAPKSLAKPTSNDRDRGDGEGVSDTGATGGGKPVSDSASRTARPNQADKRAEKSPAQSMNQTRPESRDKPIESTSPAQGSFWNWFLLAVRWLLFIGLLLCAWVWRSAIVQGFKELWLAILRWLKRDKGAGETDASANSPLSPPGMAQRIYDNPFTHGSAVQWPVEEIVRYTFAALRDGWTARNPGLGADRSRTPWEYAVLAAAETPENAEIILRLARNYVGLDYGGRIVDARDAMETSRQMWHAMTR